MPKFKEPSADEPLKRAGQFIKNLLKLFIDVLIPWNSDNPTAKKIALLFAFAVDLLILFYSLVGMKEAMGSQPGASLIWLVALPLFALALRLLTLHWRRWRRLKSKIEEIQELSPPVIPLRRDAGHFSVARHYEFPLGLLLWLFFLSILLLPLVIYYLMDVLPNSWRSQLSLIWWSIKSHGSMLMILQIIFTIPLVIVIDGCLRHIWRQWRYGYDAASDSFFRDSGFILGSLRREKSWPADNFAAIYWEKYDHDKAQLWLKSRDNYEDLLLADLKLWYPGNERFARQLAEELGAASGLKLINRLPRS